MHHRLPFLVALLALGFFAGCGGGNSELSADKIENEATAENPKPENPRATPPIKTIAQKYAHSVTERLTKQHLAFWQVW